MRRSVEIPSRLKTGKLSLGTAPNRRKKPIRQFAALSWMVSSLLSSIEEALEAMPRRCCWEKPGQRCRCAAEKAGKAVWRGPQTALQPFVDRQAQDGRQPAGGHIDAAGKRCQPAPGQVKNKQRPVTAARAFRRQQQNDEQQRQHDLERILGSVQEQHVPITKDIELVRQQDCQNGERGFGNAAAHAADQGIEQSGPTRPAGSHSRTRRPGSGCVLIRKTAAPISLCSPLPLW